MNLNWSPNIAYIVGLIATDGSLSIDGRHIIFRSSDFQLIETFAKCLDLNNKISATRHDQWAIRQAYKLQFGDVKLYKWLGEIGIHPNKTSNIGVLKIPDLYFRDFLRGHLDGDGSVITYEDRWHTNKNSQYVYQRLQVRFQSASEIHIRWLQSKVYELFGLDGFLTCQKPNSYQTMNCWRLAFAKNKSIKLLRTLYYADDLPCLLRKRIKSELFVNRLTIK